MKLNRFAKYAWFVVGWNILVILGGAFVRATGSGAGCGSHWPLCNGEVVPLNPSVERVIEFTHRTLSGIDLPLVLILVIWAFRAFPWGRVRYGALASLTFTLLEALIGARLVLQGLVAENTSAERGIWVALHLANTFLLLAALSLTAWWISGGRAVQLRGRPLRTALVVLGLLGIALVGMTGAITALGDTLFPASSLAEGLKQDTNPASHLFVQLRVVHPLIALGVGAYLILLTFVFKGDEGTTTNKLAVALRVLVVVQILAGALNVALLAPTWMQIVHLLLADLLWITLVLYGASLLAVETTAEREPTAPRGAVNVPAQ